MTKKFEDLAELALEANKIAKELYGPGGELEDKYGLSVQFELEIIITSAVLEKNRKGLQEILSDYIETFNDLSGSQRRKTDERLKNAAGLDVAALRKLTLDRGYGILKKRSISSAQEYLELELYRNLLKNDSETKLKEILEVEEILGRFAQTYGD